MGSNTQSAAAHLGNSMNFNSSMAGLGNRNLKDGGGPGGPGGPGGGSRSSGMGGGSGSGMGGGTSIGGPGARNNPKANFTTSMNDDNADDDKCFRQMFDKNTLRTEKGGQLFQNVIEKIQNNPSLVPELIPPEGLPPFKGSKNGVNVYVRKRPLFPKERLGGDFDTISIHPTHCDVHNCLYNADLKTPFLQHNSFHMDMCFGEASTNDQVYGTAARGLVAHACRGGISTM